MATITDEQLDAQTRDVTRFLGWSGVAALTAIVLVVVADPSIYFPLDCDPPIWIECWLFAIWTRLVLWT